jgi:phosphoenolpyruvate phosphomutase
MRETSARIMRDENLLGVEDNITSVKDIFALAQNDELAEAEKRYLPSTQSDTRAIILAASRGAALGGMTEDLPKCMLDIRGQPLLHRLVSTFNQEKIRKITVVRGYKKDKVNLPSIDFLDNDRFADTGEAATLAVAAEHLEGDCIVAYGDILFRHYILEMLSEADGDITIVVDARWRERDPDPTSRTRDLVQCSHDFQPGYLQDEPVKLQSIGADLDADKINGEWIGLAKFSGGATAKIKDILSDLSASEKLDGASMIDLLQAIMALGEEVRVLYINGHWMDVDNASDLEDAQKFL